MPPLSYTREQMLAIIRRGESVTINGRVISDPAYLPSQAELALSQGGEAERQKALEQIDSQMSHLQDQRDLLTNPPRDAETVHTAFGAFPGGKARGAGTVAAKAPAAEPDRDEGGNDEYDNLSEEELEALTRPVGQGGGQGESPPRPDNLAKARKALADKRQRDKDEKARLAAYPPGSQPPPAGAQLPQGGPQTPPAPKTDQTPNPPDRQPIP